VIPLWKLSSSASWFRLKPCFPLFAIQKKRFPFFHIALRCFFKFSSKNYQQTGERCLYWTVIYYNPELTLNWLPKDQGKKIFKIVYWSVSEETFECTSFIDLRVEERNCFHFFKAFIFLFFSEIAFLNCGLGSFWRLLNVLKFCNKV